MQFREKSGQSLVEPVTATEIKTFAGYSGTDQDAYLGNLSKAVRQWVERYTGQSAIAKVYEVMFEEGDDCNGWYYLPISPKNAIVSTEVGGSAVTCSEKGLVDVALYPGFDLDYRGLDVEYSVTASEYLPILEECILRICLDLFMNKRDKSELSLSDVYFDTKMLLDSIKKPAI